jgi:transcriptional regulator
VVAHNVVAGYGRCPTIVDLDVVERVASSCHRVDRLFTCREAPMYQPTHGHFREDRLDVQHALIRAHPLGAMVTLGPDGLVANHFPFIVDPHGSPLGTLQSHMARANSQWRDLDGSRDALVIFQGAGAYISPSWYPAKRETGKVVPTWNYAIVHVYGRPRIVQDGAWLLRHVSELSDVNEAGRAEPWRVSDAPAEHVGALLKAIVGIEIEITRIEGKWKVSQNQPESAREGVVTGLTADGDERSREMAALVTTALRAEPR